VRVVPTRSSQSLRADARDNRDRIVEVARELFTARGLDVPVREIARRAGVGPATLYRRFPTKQALLDAAFDEQVRECRSVVDGALGDPDAWGALTRLIADGGELYARSAGFTEAYAATRPGATDVAASRAHSHHVVAQVARRVRETGQVRPDVGPADLILLLTAQRGLGTGSAASRRFVELALRGLRRPSRS
jgi:AcrR family transcriptional regulator